MLNYHQMPMQLHVTATFTFKEYFVINVVVINTREINNHLSHKKVLPINFMLFSLSSHLSQE